MARVAAAWLLAAAVVARAASASDWPAPISVATGVGGVVACEDSLAAEVGIQVLRDGGNAADAAIAIALALAVTHPQAGNLGGGGFLLGFDATRDRAWAVDFRETAPQAADSTFYLRLDAAGKPRASLEGSLSAAIPGSPAGLHAAWERHGELPWRRLVAPAVELAEAGFTVSRALADALAERVAEHPAIAAGAAPLYPGGRPPREGDRLSVRQLAAALRTLEDEGPEPFYHGEIAAALVDGVRAAGGVWTLDDLRSYRPRWVEPARLPLQFPRAVGGSTDGGRPADLTMLAMPPPSSSAMVLGQTLAFLRQQPAAALPAGDAGRAAALVEALRLAFADRNTHLADPARMRVDLGQLLDPSYLEARARLLPPPGHAGQSSGIGAGEPGQQRRRREGSHTTHIAVLDALGSAVSLTTTLNDNFGSGWMPPGTGILLNDEMDDFDTRPGEPNLYGLVGQGRNAVAGGMRPLSSMSPLIVLRDGRPWLVLGAAGGARILTAVLQVLAYRIQDGMPLPQAVAAPRVHHQWLPDAVWEEEGRRWPGLGPALRARGYELLTRDVIGRVHAVELRDDGRFVGVADPRARGRAQTVSPVSER